MQCWPHNGIAMCYQGFLFVLPSIVWNSFILVYVSSVSAVFVPFVGCSRVEVLFLSYHHDLVFVSFRIWWQRCYLLTDTQPIRRKSDKRPFKSLRQSTFHYSYSRFNCYYCYINIFLILKCCHLFPCTWRWQHVMSNTEAKYIQTPKVLIEKDLILFVFCFFFLTICPSKCKYHNGY